MRLRDLLRPFRATVVFYPRRQDHWIVANLCNAVNLNHRPDIRFGDILDMASECLNYASLMDRWARLFGREAILIRPYEKLQMPGGTLVDFCENVLHCPAPAAERSRRSNETPGAIFIRLMQMVNGIVGDENIDEEIRLMGREDSARDSFLLMGHAQRLSILQRFADENARLAREYMGREDGCLFLEPAPSAPTHPDPEKTFAPERMRTAIDTLRSRLVKRAVVPAPDFWDFLLGRPTTVAVGASCAGELVTAEGAASPEPALVVSLPAGFVPERRYAARVLLSEIMGLNVFLRNHDGADYTISHPDGRPILTIADALFRAADETSWPFSLPHPAEPVLFHDPLTDLDLVSFYGRPKCGIRDGIPHCAADIFGMAFFLLSRVGDRLAPHDKLGRPLLGMQKPFLHRPVLNEWADFIGHFLRECGIAGKPPSGFSLHMTHDVDHLDTETAALMEIAAIDNALGMRSTFNFMSMPSSTGFDDGYFMEDREGTMKIIEQVRVKFGHSIGFHPGFNTCISPAWWRVQKDALQEAAGIPITEGRQHFLKYVHPFTWRIFEENGMTLDTGISYASESGFQMGTGMTVTAFDFLARCRMNLKILPLLVMDAAYGFCENTEKIFGMSMSVISQCKKYSMPCCMLFHNTFFAYHDARKRMDGYVRMLKSI